MTTQTDCEITVSRRNVALTHPAWNVGEDSLVAIFRHVLRELLLKRSARSAFRFIGDAATSRDCDSTFGWFVVPTGLSGGRDDDAFSRLTPAWHESVRSRLRDAPPSVREQVQEALASRSWSCLFDEEPDIALSETGTLIVEWNRPGRKLDVHFEPNPADSGWVFGSRTGDVVRTEVGNLAELDLTELLSKLRA